MLVDSTGLKLCGVGEWLIEKHGAKTRRSWRKLHISLNSDTGQIVAATLTRKEVDDGSQVGPLLDQVTASVASFTADGAYDQDGVAATVAERHPKAATIVPPRSTAVPSETAETAPTQRDRHLQFIAEHGRAAWQKASGYTEAGSRRGGHRPVQAGPPTGCARARTNVGRPRWTSPSMPSTACWSWDARSPSASPEPETGLGQLHPNLRSVQHGCNGACIATGHARTHHWATGHPRRRSSCQACPCCRPGSQARPGHISRP